MISLVLICATVLAIAVIVAVGINVHQRHEMTWRRDMQRSDHEHTLALRQVTSDAAMADAIKLLDEALKQATKRLEKLEMQSGFKR